MTEGPAVWKITPPLDPGPAYHVWHEDDQAWGEAHADWDAPPGLTSIWPPESWALAIAVAAKNALPALAEIVRTYGFPQFVDMPAVRELVQLLQAQEGAGDDL